MIDARFVFLERPKALGHERSRFEASYAKTLKDLDRELKHLDARQITIQAGFRQVRGDGWPYSSAKAEHPACILQFRSKGQSLLFKASKYDTFESNLRAITLTLEALRAVDRYGVVEGEQYAGFKQLGDGQSKPAAVTPLEAAAWLSSLSGVSPITSILHNREIRDEAYRKAARELHPDNKETGNHDQFVKLQGNDEDPAGDGSGRMRATLREVEVLTGVSWSDRAMQAERELVAVRDELAAARDTRDRYERALKAFARFAAPDSGLAYADFDEWMELTVAALLDGMEAECPLCSTHVHEGACVSDGDEDEDGEDADEPPTCDACGDTRGTCIHV